MISKCQNIVINRTKFSDFEEFDTSSQSTEGLKLVGFVETYDYCSGETIKKNVAVEYPTITVTAQNASNFVINDIINNDFNANIISIDTINGIDYYRVSSSFNGETILINFKGYKFSDIADKFFPVNINGVNYKCFMISFDNYIPTGKEIKVIFANFPMHEDNVGVCLADYSKSAEGNIGGISRKELLFVGNKEIESEKTCIVTFRQNLNKNSSTDSANNRKMAVTRIELID
jgi:hypothetical protein